MSDLPAYRIRRSRRARSVRLSLCPIRGLEVVVPEGYDPGHVPGLLQQHRDWLERARVRLERWRDSCDPGYERPLPERLALRAIGEDWTVGYEAGPAARVRVRGGNLVVGGDPADPTARRRALRAWLRRRAGERLVPWLARVAERTRLGFERVTIRSQRTRWASCSAKRAISLNYKILFLPPDLVDYLFVHELCHTRHMNHSGRFWALVERHCPDYRARERELAAAWRFIPLWNEMD